MADEVETSVETPVQSTSTDAVEVEMGRDNVDTSPLLDAVRAESPAVQLSEALSKLIVALLCCSTLAVTMCFSVIVPFFPEEAVARGMEEWMTGIIVAIYQFTALASGLVYGTFGNDIGWRWMMIVGNLSLGFATALFGTLQWSPHGDTFVFLTVGIRGFQGLSGSAVNTAVLTLILKQFPNKAALLMGTMEAFAGSAYIIGPLIGGALFKEGGFLLPFVVCGGIVLIMGVVCIFLLPPQLDVIRTDDGASYKKLFAIPAVWLPILSLLAISVTMSFFDLTIAQHMDTYQMDIWAKVEMLALLSGIYLVMAPTWGWLVDKRGVYRQVMTVGAFINSVALLLLGPSPLILNEGSVWLLGVALSILGLGLGAQLIPPFADVLQTARLNGFPEDTGTLGRVSGLINTAIPLGSFVGPLAGGFVVERYGFAKSQTGLAGLNLLVFFMLCANFGYRWLIRRRLNRSPLDQSQHNEAT